MFSQIHASTYIVNFRAFLSPQKKSLHPLANTHLLFLHPASPKQPLTYFPSLGACLFWTSHKDGTL